MEELFLLHSAHGHGPVRAGSSAFIMKRSTTGLSRADSDDQGSDCSECGGLAAQSVSGRIALAKRVLAEATQTFSAAVSVTAAKSDKCRNTGALGPLVTMIQSGADVETLCCCLDTLSFMLLDKANRLVVNELGGLQVVMSLFTAHTDPTLLRMALECVVSMVKADDREKERVWRHPGKAAIIGLLHTRAPPTQLLEVMCMVRKIAFRGAPPTGPQEILEPALLDVVAALLASTQPQAVMLKCCKFLKYAGECASVGHVEAWQRLVSLLVPMLRNPAVTDGVLGVLGSLSELYAFKNMFTAAGGVPILLPLLSHPVRTVRLAASCVLSCLSEGGLSRELLCSQPCLDTLLRILTASQQCDEVAVAVVYAVHNACRHHRGAATHLLELSALPRLTHLLSECSDGELRMGLAQLLQVLQAVSAQSAPQGGNSPPHSAGRIARLPPGCSRLSLASPPPMLHQPLTITQQPEHDALTTMDDAHAWRAACSTSVLAPDDESGPPCAVLSSLSSNTLGGSGACSSRDAAHVPSHAAKRVQLATIADTKLPESHFLSSGSTCSMGSVSLYPSDMSRTASPHPLLDTHGLENLSTLVFGGERSTEPLTRVQQSRRSADDANRAAAQAVTTSTPSNLSLLPLVLGATRLGLQKAYASSPCLLRASGVDNAVAIQGC